MFRRITTISLIGLFSILLSVLIVTAESSDQRLAKNLYIVFDGSGSMWQQKCAGGDYKINVAKNALLTFLSSVPSEYNLGLFVFDDKGSREIYQLGTINRATLSDRVKSIFAGGKTPLCNALDQASRVMGEQKKKQLGYGEFTVLVVTDGEADNIQALPVHVQKLTDQGITIQVIGFCLDTEHSLKRMVHKYREANSADELSAAMEAVLGEADTYTDMHTFENPDD